jgi:prepilin-type N-terminal cleavage/methylation domain-containing protein
MRNQRARPGRAAFTLLELLIVVAIIGILVLLSAGAAIRMMGGTASSATRTAINRVGITLSGQMTYVADQARKESIPASIDSLAGGDRDRARVILIKLRMKQAFPQSFFEALYPGRDPASGAEYVQPRPSYVTYLKQAGITRASYNPALGPPAPAAHESAACLYMALRHGPEAVGEEQLGLSGSTVTIGGLPCLSDAFGQPLLFCRWPVGDHSASPPSGVSVANPGGYADGANDPGDPRATLNDATWQTSAGGQAFQRVCHPLFPRSLGLRTLNLSALVMSGGADKAPGVDFFTFASTGPASNDNILGGRLK